MCGSDFFRYALVQSSCRILWNSVCENRWCIRAQVARINKALAASPPGKRVAQRVGWQQTCVSQLHSGDCPFRAGRVVGLGAAHRQSHARASTFPEAASFVAHLQTAYDDGRVRPRQLETHLVVQQPMSQSAVACSLLRSIASSACSATFCRADFMHPCRPA